VITRLTTNHSCTIGDKFGEDSFGIVFECIDDWNNELAVKWLKPVGTNEKVRAAATSPLRSGSTTRYRQRCRPPSPSSSSRGSHRPEP